MISKKSKATVQLCLEFPDVLNAIVLGAEVIDLSARGFHKS